MQGYKLKTLSVVFGAYDFNELLIKVLEVRLLIFPSSSLFLHHHVAMLRVYI